MKQTLVMYRSQVGQYYSQWYPSGQPYPPVVEVEGVVYAIPEVAVQNRKGRGLQVMSDPSALRGDSSLPRWHGKGTREGHFWRHYTKEGKPIVDSRYAYSEACRRAADHGEILSRARDHNDE